VSPIATENAPEPYSPASLPQKAPALTWIRPTRRIGNGAAHVRPSVVVKNRRRIAGVGSRSGAVLHYGVGCPTRGGPRNYHLPASAPAHAPMHTNAMYHGLLADFLQA